MLSSNRSFWLICLLRYCPLLHLHEASPAPYMQLSVLRYSLTTLTYLRLRPLLDCYSHAQIASTSATAPQSHRIQLLLPDCICFRSCSPIASASATALWLCPLATPAILEGSSHCPTFWSILRGVLKGHPSLD